MPSNVPATPNTVMQTYGTEGDRAEFLPLLIEIFRDAKAIFKAPPAEIFVKGTGGAQFAFYKNHGLEDAIQAMGEELHSQYMLSYSPNNKEEDVYKRQAFDSRVRTMQDFTSDTDRITAAVMRIHAGSISSRLVDAVDSAEHMLRSRPKDRQKIILLISETRDEGSVNRGPETLDYVQVNNVMVYTITMSRVLGKLTSRPADPPPDPWLPAMHPMPSFVPATPTTVEQTYGTGGNSAQFVPLFAEVLKDIKAIYRVPAADLFTQGTGGSKFDFYRGKGLEDAIQQMSAELHLQYMLSYSPNDKDEGGWHDIRVEVTGISNEKVRTRPGYWMAAESNQ